MYFLYVHSLLNTLPHPLHFSCLSMVVGQPANTNVDSFTLVVAKDVTVTAKFDPQLNKHIANCDLCGYPVKIPKSGSPSNLLNHRHSGPCRKGQQHRATTTKPPALAIDTSSIRPTSGLYSSDGGSTFPSPATSVQSVTSYTHSTPSPSSLLPYPSSSRVAAPSGLHSRSSSLSAPIAALSVASSLTPAPTTSCPGFQVRFDSIWSGYAFSAHDGSKYAWRPTELHPETDSLTMRAIKCTGSMRICDHICVKCLLVDQSKELKDFLRRGNGPARSGTPYKYLTAAQISALLQERTLKLKRANEKVR
jgi:hypothetical protein